MQNKYVYIAAALITAALIHPVYIFDRIETYKKGKTSYSIGAPDNRLSMKNNESKTISPDKIYLELSDGDIFILVLENLLIFSLIVAGAAMIFIVNSRKKKSVNAERSSPLLKDIDADTHLTAPDNEKNSDLLKFDPLSALVYEFFSSVFTSFSLDEISLYVYNRPGRLSKVYELKGNRLIKIEGGNFDGIDISPDALSALSNSQFLLNDAGRNLQIPMKKLRPLIGIILIKRSQPLRGDEIQNIIADERGLLKQMSGLINTNDLMIDPATGLYREAYLKLKIAEFARGLNRDQPRYSAAALSIFSGQPPLADEDRFRVIETIAPAVSDIIKGENFAAIRGDYIIIIFSGSDTKSAAAITKRLVKELDRYRIKLKPGLTVQLKTAAGLCGPEEASEDIIATAVSRIGDIKIL